VNPLYWLLAAIGIALELVLVYSLTAKRYSIRLPYLYAYSIVLVSTEGIDVGMRILQPSLTLSASRIWVYYWFDDFLRQLSLFLVVLSLLYLTGGHSAGAKRLRQRAIAVVIVVAVASAFYFRTERQGMWATDVVRNVSFAVVFVNLVLWSAFIRSGDPQRLPLMLSAGIGLQMTGEAMGQALRSSPIHHRFPIVVLLGNLILILSHILCLVTWLYALRADERRLAAAARSQEHSQPASDPPSAQGVTFCQIASPEFHPANPLL
jgi:hypothetical protein